MIGGPVGPPGGGPLNSTAAIFVGWLVAIIALYVIDRGGPVTFPNPVPGIIPVIGGSRIRIPVPGNRGPLFWVGSLGATLLALELNSGFVSRTLFRTATGLTKPLQQVVPLAGITAIGLTSYYLYQRFIVGQQARDIVIRSDGGEDQ